MHDKRNRAATGNGTWSLATCAFLSVWVITSPPALGYGGEPLALSDYLSGALGLVLSCVAIRMQSTLWPRWGICVVGIWLLHAPLIFWTPSAAAYASNTLMGIGLIAFSVVVPREQWRRHPTDQVRPDGWSFNPSSWAQRTPIIALAWINFFLARYLAAYQLDHITWPWDPFFGDGTQRVLDSDISEAFPISDAGLGATAYVIEALIGYMGSTDRWRTAPWTVALFGILVVPVGVVSTVLMILQPVAVGAWCTICLVTAAFMMVMACLALPEVVAMLQYLARRRRVGHSLWSTFWLGGATDSDLPQQPTSDASYPISRFVRDMVAGTTISWPLALSTLIGIWFVAASDILGMTGRVMDAHVIIGAIVIVCSILAMAEVTRIARFINAPAGLVLAVIVWVVEGATIPGQLTTTAAGVGLAVLSLPRGKVQHTYGDWQRWIR